MQNVKVIDLIGGQVNEVEFDTFSGCYLVKNFSDGDVKFSYDENWDDTSYIRIPSMIAEQIPYNEAFWGQNVNQTNKVYLMGTGRVEIHQLA